MKRLFLLCFLVLAFVPGCDDDGSDASDRGVGEACATNEDCKNDDLNYSDDIVEPAELLECLTEFKAGYCGLKGCEEHADCPDGSKCVITDGGNYCFLVCAEKPDCNEYRDADSEANCVGSAELIDGANDVKVCVPPSA